jgi:GT2 family glycosyltransferase
MGGFDSLFFAHMEEIDLCWRLKNAGYAVWYTPRSTVYHVGGGMLPQSSPFKTFLNYRNNLLMLYKNLPFRKQRNRILFIRMALDGLSAIHSLLKGDISTFKAILKAHASFRKLRRAYSLSLDRHDKTLSDPSCIYPYSIVYQYFIKRRKTFGSLPNIFSAL